MLASWRDVGYFPTPVQLVADLIDALTEQLGRIEFGTHVRVLDACAGDGRLGLAVMDALARKGISCELTCIEVDPSRIPVEENRSSGVNWLNQNFLKSEISGEFDIVVSNPPYLVLNRRDADHFGIEWSKVIDGGRNLYSLSIARALDLCRHGGVVGLIAPHGWLRNVSMSAFRKRMSTLAESIEISAYQSRRLFDNVNQDTSIQIITRCIQSRESDPARVRIRYDKGDFLEANGFLQSSERGLLKVRVGPFVWNRERDAISVNVNEPRLPSVYGGNITSWHHLDFQVKRYRKRQYLSRAKVAQGSISVGPCVLIKRSMRGGPGRWEVDCAYVPVGFEVVAENHVIVVENIDQIVIRFGDLVSRLKYFLQESCRHQGHPSLSASSVRDALSYAIR